MVKAAEKFDCLKTKPINQLTNSISGKAESIYSATFEVNQCMQFVMSNGIAGGLKIASCGEQESPAICSRTGQFRNL